ncbi:MAG: DUF4835 family protein [Salinivirgaceae bacterium]|nr:DUF4835 family protein [Salinivirgaceae bacterium]MDD4745868.1 DUF4835 family protein [Salinivirgaceae bacterium]MDY0278934.1 DUF4835 family protein [Salinivirgaceae bacterium]
MKHILTFLALLIFIGVEAQEINCRIQINSRQIQSSDRTLFEEMQKAAFEFFNNTVFTNQSIKTLERIEFNMNITLNEKLGADEYRGEIQVAYSRPIFGSGYNSPVLNLKDDKLIFRFALGDQIQFNINSSQSTLASVLSYYAYLILAIDYDTFSLKGGQTYLKVAEKIVNNAMNDPSPGWRAFEDNGKNRAAIVEELLNDMYGPLRECWYQYHRLGLDLMHEKPDQGRKAVIEALEKLRPIYQRRSDSYLLQLFVNAKSDEIIGIFSEGSPDEKRRAFNIMNTIDPANSEKYKKINSQ